MDKDIQKLIERFMAGQTSIEEEDILAEYFRSHKVKDEWKAYKEMFGWFDNGMQLDSKRSAKTRTKLMSLTALISTVAAAIAIMLIIALPGSKECTAITGTPKVETKTYTCQTYITDTTTTDSAVTTKPKRKIPKRKYKKDAYNVTPPKTYLAKQQNDSINRLAEQLAEEKLNEIYRRQEDMLKEIEELHNRQNIGIDIIMAVIEDDLTEYTDEDYY